MHCYLIARYSRHIEMQDIANRLMTAGHVITSRWIWGGHELPAKDCEGTRTLRDFERRFAEEDIHDLQQATCCVAFSEQLRQPTRGGRHVELGMAIALKKRIIVVGGSEHVFHALAQIEHVSNLSALLRQMQA